MTKRPRNSRGDNGRIPEMDGDRIVESMSNLISQRSDRPIIPHNLMLYLPGENLFLPLSDSEFLDYEFPEEIDQLLRTGSKEIVVVRCFSGPSYWSKNMNGNYSKHIDIVRMMNTQKIEWQEYLVLKHPYTGWFDIPDDKVNDFLGAFGTTKTSMLRYMQRDYRSATISRFRLKCDPRLQEKMMDDYDHVLEIREDVNKTRQEMIDNGLM